MNQRIKDACTADSCQWNYDFTEAPFGQRCLLLNAGGVAVIGMVAPRGQDRKYFKAWAPLPKRDKAKEEALGILT